VEFSDVDARGQRGQHPQVRRASLVVRPVRRAVEQRPIHRREFLVLVVDVKGVVGGEANPGHVGQSGGTAWQESSDLALPVYIMSKIMVFVMWALVGAIPCQERNGLLTHFPVPRQLGWAQSMIVLQDRIAEEWKKKKEEQVCWEGIFVT
jgi:hypothetical protein